jgi:hypothetical protein
MCSKILSQFSEAPSDDTMVVSYLINAWKPITNEIKKIYLFIFTNEIIANKSSYESFFVVFT